MIVSNERLIAKVSGQKVIAPSIYGDFDFDAVPERFTTEPGVRSQLHEHNRKADLIRDDLLANKDIVDIIGAYTLVGDAVCDAYAALAPERYKVRELISMLVAACERGVDEVPGAPPELVAFIRDMERVPDGINMALIEEGARRKRNQVGHVYPYVIQVGLLGTYLNVYTALPMALTGSLATKGARRRILETINYEAVTLLPGALDRYGEGFKISAMVRLMHSMVRKNLLRSGKWDPAVYGVPIPQIDQLSAGMVMEASLARKALSKGRTTFTRAEQAQVECARYRAYLLGVPEDLLPGTPRELVTMMDTRMATVRERFDDRICSGLMKATLEADLAPNDRWVSRIRQSLSITLGKWFFTNFYMRGDKAAAEAVFGVKNTPADRVRLPLAVIWVLGRAAVLGTAQNIPVIGRLADTILVWQLKRVTKRCGHGEYVSDASGYAPVEKAAG
ncbi:oxygenase MpaB family protein [Nocardia cyriacigeorgica]|uniref:oxygenase MpaB family protein n=1 Tax=Nocardia cyriacigeorgica TaxID=135487 RepID=UPI0024547EE5|nr:oxygenase MpaB family protein [Nocardia cyriacigeorgica]